MRKKKKQAVKVPIKYPTWRVRGNPTPNEKLMVCDRCGAASWMPHSPLTHVAEHTCPDNTKCRMRKATAAEYEQGKAVCKEII